MRSIFILVCGLAVVSCAGGAVPDKPADPGSGSAPDTVAGIIPDTIPGTAPATTSGTTSDPGSATVTVDFPTLMDEGGAKVLATYVSHVIATESHPLASITLRDTGAAATFQVSVDLPRYGSPGTTTVSLAAGESRQVALSPVLDFTALFALTTAVPAALEVTVSSGSATVFRQSYPIQISGRDTVFWSSETVPLVATMVTPQDRVGAIASLLRGAADRFPGSALVGYQPVSWPAASFTLGPGEWQEEVLYLMAGEQLDVDIEAATDAASGQPALDLAVAILDDAGYSAWTSGEDASSCAVQTGASAGGTVACVAPSANAYHVVYVNPGSSAGLTVTRSRSMTRYEVTYEQTRAIFDELRARGVVYVNLPGTGFFSQAENVKYPAESLSTRSANCVDGALVFASAWEALGMEPVLAFTFTHGHAFAAVRCWAGSDDCLVPVETTMVGGGDSFDDAVEAAGSEWESFAADRSLVIVDIAEARAHQLTPAPM